MLNFRRFDDKKSGIVVRHSADGMEEVSNYGMKDYFRDNLRAQTGFIYGSYDETSQFFGKIYYHIFFCGSFFYFFDTMVFFSRFA